MIRQMVKEFAKAEIAPLAQTIDEQAVFPVKTFQKMGELGFMGIPFPEKYGGSGGDTISYALAVEEIGKQCASTGLSYAAAVSLGARPLYYFGTEEQKMDHLVRQHLNSTRFLRINRTKRRFRCKGTKTKAIKDGQEYIISGEKCWITNANYARTIIVTAVTDHDEHGRPVISAFIVEKGQKGISITNPYDKMGVRGSDTAEIILNEVRVPAHHILGDPNKGFKQFLYTLDGGRF